MTCARFDIINIPSGAETTKRIATFYAHDKAALLAQLQDRLASLVGNRALVAVNGEALEMLLRLTPGVQPAPGPSEDEDNRCHGECGLHSGVLR